jgi:uncharacterized membrane protein
MNVPRLQAINAYDEAMKRTLICGLSMCLALLAACGDDDDASGGDCSASDAPTYDTFGRAFIDEYCASCHGANVTGTARNGAPAGATLSTLAEIQAQADALRQVVSIGKTMPAEEASKKPSDEERELFGTWMACDAK